MDGPSVTIVGVHGSPYSRKLRAVLRYRRIPHVWITHGSPESLGLPAPRVGLIPMIVARDEDGTLQSKVDSTPLIRELERDYQGRSVVPTDPALAFLDALLEDYADEWLTKAMFHYRWSYDADIAKAKAILPRWVTTNVAEEELVHAGETFGARQIERLAVVGSSDATAPIIERSYRRLLGLLDTRLTHSRYVLGARPSVCDFALYGQLTQLTGFDPTPSAIALESAPRVAAWVDLVDDLSGVESREEDWIDARSVPTDVKAIFAEVGRVYAPFLLANARAIDDGAATVECDIDGLRWLQRPFPYQHRCLSSLRRSYAQLESSARVRVDAALEGTGCERLFEP